MQFASEWSKLLTVVLVIISVTVMAALKIVGGDAAVGILGACLGYVFGNGHGILSAKRVGYPVDTPVEVPAPAGGVRRVAAGP